MELTAADEIVAMENMDVLHANGFDVDVDEDAAPGRGERIRLKAMPISKETTFDFKGTCYVLHEFDTQISSSSSICCLTVLDQRARWCGVPRRGPCLPCARAGGVS